MKYFLTALIVFLSAQCFCQSEVLTLDQAVALALKNNLQIKSEEHKVIAQKQLEKTSFALPKTDVTLLYGQYNSFAKNDNNITVSQTVPLSAFGSHGALNRAHTASAELHKTVTDNDIVYKTKHAYLQLAYFLAVQKLLEQQDSIYEGFEKSASLRYKTGESTLLEQTTAKVQRGEGVIQLQQNQAEIVKWKSQLMTLTNTSELPLVPALPMVPISQNYVADTVAATDNPSVNYWKQQIEVSSRERKLSLAELAPDLIIGFFNQTLIGTIYQDKTVASANDRFTGIQLGLSIPLWFVPQRARIKSADANVRAAEANYASYIQSVRHELEQAIQQIKTNVTSLQYFSESTLPNAELVLKQSQVAFREGEIGYAEYLLGIRDALRTKERYLETLNGYNQSIIYYEYLTGKK
jgi:heavy metal efflux system protein